MSSELQTEKEFFLEKIRQLSVVDQKAAALLAANALLFTGTVALGTGESAESISAWGSRAIELALLVSALLSMRGLNMLPTTNDWPLSAREITAERVRAQTSDLRKIASGRRKFLNFSWWITLFATIGLLLLVVLRAL